MTTEITTTTGRAQITVDHLGPLVDMVIDSVQSVHTESACGAALIGHVGADGLMTDERVFSSGSPAAAAGIEGGPVFRSVLKGGRVQAGAMTPQAVRNVVKAAGRKLGLGIAPPRPTQDIRPPEPQRGRRHSADSVEPGSLIH